ncbi:hypothetical protein V5O48_004116 [Marasmius crinis-equi]|uniref:Cupredoxin n=1 Tax=Marasmius crinis-equi TaxID=585013 RepID=A0ABR3FR93_9AGAR
MRFSVAATITLSSIAAAVAQNTQTITVGKDGKLIFDPSSVNVTQGDILSFNFVSKNHSVVQSTFADPCTALDNGFKSGFQNIADGAQPVVVNFTVNDTSKPLWFYCGQKNPLDHCASGMVLAINPTDNLTFDAFQGKANSTNSTASGGSGSGSGSGSGDNSTQGGNSSGGNGAVSLNMNTFSLLAVAGIALGLVL